MKDEEEERSASSSSSRPPSPLPVSTGPDNEEYSFTPSPSLSPPGSSHASMENIVVVRDCKLSDSKRAYAPSSFSVDRLLPADDSLSRSSCCLKELLEWFVLRCCSCCSWDFNSPSKLHQS